MTKAIIFDLNGIFIESERLSDRFLRDFNVPLDLFLPRLGEIMDKVRLPGAEPAWVYWQPVLESWGVKMDELAFWKYWFEAEKPSAKMIELAKAKYPALEFHQMAAEELDLGDQKFDYIITTCDIAREACPTFPGDPEQIHWSFADPAAVQGAEARLRAFKTVANELTTRINYLLLLISVERGKQRSKGSPATNKD